MRYSILLAITILIFTFGCNKKIGETVSATTPVNENVPALKTVAFGQGETLRIGEGFRLEKSDATFRFVAVELDSRCPTGVNCVQEGEAQVTVAVNGNPQRVTIGNNGKSSTRVRITGGTVSILGLDPYPQGEVRLKAEDRRLRVRITKSADM